MNLKYERAINELENNGTTRMKVFGSSMTPKIESGSMLTFIKETEYVVGQIVFCSVHGRMIDAHLVKKKDKQKGYLIANNHGHENGWTRKIFGRVILSEYKGIEHKFS